jgi:uncharacterized membrane protein
MKHPVNVKHLDNRSVGEIAADAIAAGMGSWRFIIVQTIIVLSWILLNSIEFLTHRWDPYPFILLNLVFSTQAAYAAPIIMQSQNRQAAKDRDLLEHAYQDAEEHKRLLLENTEITKGIHTLLEREKSTSIN